MGEDLVVGPCVFRWYLMLEGGSGRRVRRQRRKDGVRLRKSFLWTRDGPVTREWRTASASGCPGPSPCPVAGRPGYMTPPRRSWSGIGKCRRLVDQRHRWR